MQKKGGRLIRDPYYYWKILNMLLACAVLILSAMIVLGKKSGFLVPAAFFLGALMCALSGIMELAKSKRVIGYICSVFAGILAVAFIFSIVRLWFL
ncbi:MAG TPA: hypothetical protein IAB61_05750 [Candidatus Merdisoma merdipullorum]|nr:hypothetical protein [Candidatus Merdisoma merdipullorum]